MNNARKENNFSLIELLVVVSIIVLLMSILLPALEKARESAKTQTCANGLKNIGQIVTCYAGDSNGWAPPPYNGIQAWGWILANEGYVNNKTLLYCPSYYIPANMNLSYSYGMIGYTNVTCTRLSPFVPSPVTALGPSELFICIDSKVFIDTALGWYHIYRDDVNASQKKPCTRHMGTAVSVFADGHIERLKAQALWDKYHYSSYSK